MLNEIKVSQILFLDVETVPQYQNYAQLPDEMKHFWERKAKFLARNDERPEELYSRAGIYAEFGKIICISTGFFYVQNGKRAFKIKSFYGDNEHQLLLDFAQLLSSSALKNKLLCAHNGKEFDFPYLGRRMLIHGIMLPDPLQIAGKKPWEVKHLDTLELWKFGDFKHYTSLDLLAYLFKIPSPKSDLDGSMIYQTYWEENDLERIRKYCEKDVITLAQLMLRYKGLPLVEEKAITYLNE
ncbi:MAG: 3'-5' exonuclease [Flavobacteriales bacterium]